MADKRAANGCVHSKRVPGCPSCDARVAASVRRYEADMRGCIYEEYEDGSIWPTGIVIRHLAGQSQIPPAVFESELRRLDELEGRA